MLAEITRRPNEHFPSFSEGLSLRVMSEFEEPFDEDEFPFLFGGTFIEGLSAPAKAKKN